MKKGTDTTGDLKRRAEEAAQKQRFDFPDDIENLSAEAARALFHQLHVHQIELEMQNEQLRRAQERGDAARARYFDLYDLAPIGYCTLNEMGQILEANLMAASLLGVERKLLVRQPLSRFLTRESADSFFLQRRKLLETGEPLISEWQMTTAHGRTFWAHAAATVARGEKGGTTLRVALSDISKLKNAESALQAKETFNRAVLDSLDAEIAVLDRDGIVVAVNQAWWRFALENMKPSGQLDPRVRPGVNYLAICKAAARRRFEGAADAQLAHDAIKAVLDGQRPGFSLEYPCHSPEEQRWFSMNVMPFGDGVVISHTNVTHVKQLEAETAAAARYLRSLFEAILDPLATVSAKGKITDINTATEVITGVSRETLIGSDFWNYFTDPEEVRAGYQQVLAQGALIDYPLAVRHVSGKTTDVLLNASLYRDTDGETLGVFATAHDITERKRTLDKLREQKEFFHLIAENISDFIAVLDTDGRRIYSSPSYRQLLDPSRELRGTDSFGEVHPDDRDRIRRIFEETVRSGRGCQLEYRFVAAGGRIRNMESRGTVIKDGDGQVTRVVVVSRDITESKLMEYRIRQMAFHDALTQLPNRRLLNDRLNQAMAASTRSGLYGALMFLDLDNFKPINDGYGHDQGDLLLIEAAARLKSCVREMDTVARFGGDEFVVMIRELAMERSESVSEARAIAEKIRLRLSEPYRLPHERPGLPEETVEHRCTASIGVVVFVDHEASHDSILKWADAAMYRAKERGRNSVQIVELNPNNGARPVLEPR